MLFVLTCSGHTKCMNYSWGLQKLGDMCNDQALAGVNSILL